MSIRRPDENRINAIFAFLRIRDSMSRRLIGKVKVMSNKLRSFLIVVISIAVVMAALPMNALRVNADTFTLYYDGNGGVRPISSASDDATKWAQVSDDQCVATVKDNSVIGFFKEGYAVDYWTENADGSGEKYYEGNPITLAADKNVYAHWTAAYSITFVPDYPDGATVTSGTMGTQNIAIDDTKPLNANQFKCKGYRFAGWEDDEGHPYADKGSFTADSGNVTLHAQWQAVYTITYDANNNTGKVYEATIDVDPTETTYQVLANDSCGISFSGYVFDGWKDAAGTSYNAAATITLTSDITLYAQWARKITFHSNNGSDTTAIQTIPVSSTAALDSNTFTNAGESFVGWSTQANSAEIKYVDGESVKITGDNSKDVDVDLYAQWGDTCRIHFEPNYPTGTAGTGTMDDLNLGKGFTTNLNNVYSLTGYTLTQWTTEEGGGGDFYNSNAISLDGSVGNTLTLYAQWDRIPCEVKFVSEDGLTPLQTVSCYYGDIISFSEATPTKEKTDEYEFTFDGWSTAKDSQGTALTSIPAATGDTTYYAHFSSSKRHYSVSATANPSAGGTVSGSGSSYEWNSNVTVEASPSTGYHFVKWTDNGADVGTATTYSITIDGNHTVVAEFEKNSYTVTLEASAGGQATIDKTTCLYEDQVTVAAAADTGYTFVNWVQDGQVVSSDPTYTFTVTADSTVKPVFSINSYTISLSSDGNGSVEGAGDYNYSSTATLTASPNTGYYFVNWTDEDGDEVSTSATYSFTVSGSRSLKANFALYSYNIGVTAGDNGSVTGKGIYYYGESITVKAKPETGYHFVNWTIDGNVVSTNANYTFTVTGPTELTANFAINTYTVKFVNDDGTLLKEGQFVYGSTAFYHLNETPTKKPTVQYTYTFAGWDKKLGTVTDDITYTATYEATVNKYKITFKNEDGSMLQISEVEYGKLPVYEKDTPTKAATVQETFTFAGWDKEISKVTGEAVYTATYTSKPITKDSINYKYFTVAFVTNGGSEIVSQLVAEGSVAFKPEEPLRERYTFGGWYIDEALTKPFSFATAITSDITLYAKWIKGSPDIEATYAVVGLGSTSFELGSGEDITVAVERSKDNDSIATHFKGVLIDGVEVDYYNYELAEDNSSVIIRADALEGLDAGTHTVTIVYDDGTAEVELVVADANEPTAAVEKITETEAGDTEPVNVTAEKNSNWGLWIALGIVAVVVIAAIPIFIIKGRSLK